jgi:serpin B
MFVRQIAFRRCQRRSRPSSPGSAIAMAAIALILAACSSSATPSPEASQVATASPSPLLTPSPTPAATPSPSAAETPTLPPGQVVAYDVITGKAKLVAPADDNGAASASQIDAFAFDLFAHLDSSGNLCYSPTSIALSLGMVRAGARGATATQMDAVLHQFGASGQASEIVALLQDLRSKIMYVDGDGMPLDPGSTPNPAQPDPVLLLTVANQLFSQKGMSVEQAYLDALSSTYGAGMALLDFRNDPESARLTINKWASDNTKGRIPNVLQPGDVQTLTRIALANAMYLKVNWQDKFDPQNTKPGPFTTAVGTKVSVPMMSQQMVYQYSAGTGYRAIEVPFELLSSLSMVFVVPDDMASFQSQLTASKFASVLGSMKRYDVSFSLPKYSVESRVDLAKVLAAMGMSDLFSAQNADLSGITTDEKLFIDKVIHQANMDVDEEGVTAAAVTISLGLGAGAEQPPHVDFNVDKPFLYFIRDKESGAILFMGRVDDPTAAG